MGPLPERLILCNRSCLNCGAKFTAHYGDDRENIDTFEVAGLLFQCAGLRFKRVRVKKWGLQKNGYSRRNCLRSAFSSLPAVHDAEVAFAGAAHSTSLARANSGGCEREAA